MHLPQFHPFSENDEWWGKGFTEWTNVAKARPRYHGHYQPHIPADLGFYDMRLEETRCAQATLAQEYGVYGFCYYHYWFNGKRLMERPVDEMIASGKPDMPFMLCWANENWSRNWDGGFSDILIAQNYTVDDCRSHIRYLCKHVFCDKRYIKVNSRPFFIIYHPRLIPDLRDYLMIWRDEAKTYGMELYLGYMTRNDENLLDEGFDCAVDFEPNVDGYIKKDVFGQLLDFRNSNILHRAFRHFWGDSNNPFNLTYDYNDYATTRMARQSPPFKIYPGITPSWDNSSRRKGWFFEMKNSNPELYGRWLRYIVKTFLPYTDEENFIFINAWNEWAEGNHLEPDLKWGRGYLEETLRAIVQDES